MTLVVSHSVVRSEVDQVSDAEKCAHGSDGVLITLERPARVTATAAELSVSPADMFAAKIKGKWRERRRSQADKDGPNQILFTYRWCALHWSRSNGRAVLHMAACIGCATL